MYLTEVLHGVICIYVYINIYLRDKKRNFNKICKYFRAP